MKRTFDLFAATLGLLLLWPVIAALIVLVRRESEGPGIFSQRRVGRDGRPFRCHKLRTMFVDTPDMPTHDMRATQITPLGNTLRRLKLDELPQLWNVLTGDMSFVGPRPCLPAQTQLIDERSKRGVLALRPGITGIAQINGIDMSDPVRLATTDAQYLEKSGILTDLQIIFRTILGAGAGDRVRQ